MHRITNEFLNKGYIKEITEIENIDDILKLYKMNAQTKLYDIKLSKLLALQDEFKNLDLLDVKKDDQDKNSDNSDNCDNCDNYDDYDEINEWYYGNDDNKKRKFEELVINIIEKYENNKRIKLIDEEHERNKQKDNYINNIIYNLLKFSITYCFISYIFMFYNNLNKDDTITNNLNNIDNNNIEMIDNTTRDLIQEFNNLKPFKFQF